MFWNVQIPLGYYLIQFLLFAGIILWFGRLHRKEEIKREQVEHTLASVQAERDGLEEDNEEMLHGYATMAGMIEEVHTQLADIHSQCDFFTRRIGMLEERCSLLNQRLDMREQSPNIRIQFTNSQSSDYTGPDEEEPYYDPYPPALPSPDWVQNVEGLDEL